MKHSIGLKQSLEGHLIVFTSMSSLLSPSSAALENCTRPTHKPAHVHESKWQRNISRSEMKCAWVDRFFPAFSVKHTEYILVFILTLWGFHLMQSSAGAFLLNACDLKRFSIALHVRSLLVLMWQWVGALVPCAEQMRGNVKQRWSDGGDLWALSAAVRPR